MKYICHNPAVALMNDLDQIFKRDDIRGLWPDVLNSEIAFLLGEALYELLLRRGLPGTLVLGHDARKGSYDLSLAFLRGFGGWRQRAVSGWFLRTAVLCLQPICPALFRWRDDPAAQPQRI